MRPKRFTQRTNHDLNCQIVDGRGLNRNRGLSACTPSSKRIAQRNTLPSTTNSISPFVGGNETRSGGTPRVFDGRDDTTANDKNHAAAVFDLGSGAFNSA